MYLIQRVLTNKSAMDTINLHSPMSKINKKERQEWMGTLFLRYLFSNWQWCCRHELMLRNTQWSMVRASDPQRQPPADEKEGRKRVFSLFFLIHSICTSRWVKRQIILGSSSWAQGWPSSPEGVGGFLLEHYVPWTGCKALLAVTIILPGHQIPLALSSSEIRFRLFVFYSDFVKWMIKS